MTSRKRQSSDVGEVLTRIDGRLVYVGVRVVVGFVKLVRFWPVR